MESIKNTLAVESEYYRLREVGWTALQALEAARINVLFSDAEEKGDVSFEVLPDPEPYDDSYIDTWDDVPEHMREAARNETRRRIENDGVWGIRSNAKLSCGSLHDVADCWGFVGDDWQDSGYDVDLKREALREAGYKV